MWPNYTFSGCKFPTEYMCQNYENWLLGDKVIAKISRLIFWPALYVAYISGNLESLAYTFVANSMGKNRFFWAVIRIRDYSNLCSGLQKTHQSAYWPFKKTSSFKVIQSR